MVDSQIDKGGPWLSLRDACRLLDASQSTLRQWADGGYLRVYRTPGGHRRFLKEDVTAFTRLAPSVSGPGAPSALEGSALRRIRHRLHQENVARQPWYQSVEGEGRVRMRLFGRRLLSLLAQEAIPRRRRLEVLGESHLLGREYGAEMADRGVPLKDTVEAFIFFRTMVLDSAAPRAWGRIIELADRVLVGVAESYQEHQPNALIAGSGAT
ncbi:MAG: helix-turn-helix domain-containing protein [Chloroflexota bacterium]